MGPEASMLTIVLRWPPRRNVFVVDSTIYDKTDFKRLAPGCHDIQRWFEQMKRGRIIFQKPVSESERNENTNQKFNHEGSI